MEAPRLTIKSDKGRPSSSPDILSYSSAEQSVYNSCPPSSTHLGTYCLYPCCPVSHSVLLIPLLVVFIKLRSNVAALWTTTGIGALIPPVQIFMVDRANVGVVLFYGTLEILFFLVTLIRAHSQYSNFCWINENR